MGREGRGEGRLQKVRKLMQSRRGGKKRREKTREKEKERKMKRGKKCVEKIMTFKIEYERKRK